MNLLIFDNYDSFTYNIVHAVRQLGVNADVYRNDKIELKDVEKYDKIIISPGPGIPSEAGILPELLKTYSQTKPILGICLGHQAIGECFGANLINLDDVFHGVQTDIKILDSADYLFEGLPQILSVGRYHSLVAAEETIPEMLQVVARSLDGEVMAVQHKEVPVYGLQFHPESILTPEGLKIIGNWINH